MNWPLLFQLFFSFIVLVIIWVVCAIYYVLGMKRGYSEGVPDGMELAQKMITEAIRQGKVTLDGKPVRIVEKETPFIPDDGFIYGMDGNQHTCQRPDFVNLAESLCGFGDTQEKAKADLLRQEQEGWNKE